jgi:hypothetical protein
MAQSFPPFKSASASKHQLMDAEEVAHHGPPKHLLPRGPTGQILEWSLAINLTDRKAKRQSRICNSEPIIMYCGSYETAEEASNVAKLWHEAGFNRFDIRPVKNYTFLPFPFPDATPFKDAEYMDENMRELFNAEKKRNQMSVVEKAEAWYRENRGESGQEERIEHEKRKRNPLQPPEGATPCFTIGEPQRTPPPNVKNLIHLPSMKVEKEEREIVKDSEME